MDEEENVALINSSWCINRSGICLSFAIPIDVLSINEITEYGKEFIRAVKESYNDLLKNFLPKSDTPLITATPAGQIIMMWSFQGDETKELKNELKKYKIMQIKYDN